MKNRMSMLSRLKTVIVVAPTSGTELLTTVEGIVFPFTPSPSRSRKSAFDADCCSGLGVVAVLVFDPLPNESPPSRSSRMS